MRMFDNLYCAIGIVVTTIYFVAAILWIKYKKKDVLLGMDFIVVFYAIPVMLLGGWGIILMLGIPLGIGYLLYMWLNKGKSDEDPPLFPHFPPMKKL